MISRWFFAIIVLLSGSVLARSACSDIHDKQSYPPLNITNGTVCFVQEPVLDPKTNASIGAASISLYYIFKQNAPIKAQGRGLLYDDTPGKIVDAFASSVDHGQQEKIFVIHEMEVRESLVEPNSSGNFYSVAVFSLAGNALRRDERASEWFGADYSWLSDGRREVYKFPFLSRKDILLALRSPLAALISNDRPISARLKEKTYLFDGPNIRDITKKYFIKGDLVTVNKATAGWCQIKYSAERKPLEMWLACDALDVGG